LVALLSVWGFATTKVCVLYLTPSQIMSKPYAQINPTSTTITVLNSMQLLR
jgi:hypothetical protein